ncbi:hypothetical protein INT45_010104 [Circinella minor]|uniref:Tc1-like transposase DDE domain-containing protein n=1 Tax=Circinella minor TaxID=1195481 RepID=A0A8H7VD15_9FUNG|nr:hypothetical protein INT45_010104 [Circinella minor]
MAHMEFIYEFNCIADEILANSCPAELVEEADADLLYQTEMEWQGTTGGIQSLYQFGSSEIQVDEEMTEVVAANSETSDTKSRENSKKVAIKKKREERGPYRKYNALQIQQLFDFVIEMGMTAKTASLSVGIKVRTGQHYVRQYKIDNELPVIMTGAKKPLRRPPTLISEHTAFLIEYYDKHVDAVLFEARDALYEQFTDISITLSGLHKHLVDKAADYSMEHDSEFDFEKRCVFIDEAGFNLHIRRNFGRSKKGTPARAVVPTQRGVSVTILGAICELGVINVSLRKPQAVQSSKKRKRSNGTTVLNGRIGTRTEHFIEFLNKVTDVLDENGMKGRYLVMDNAPIHTNKSIEQLIEHRGYKCAYLAPYSPFLNPIEEFWSKVKQNVRRDRLSENDQLTPRITEAVKRFSANNLEKSCNTNFIEQTSENQTEDLEQRLTSSLAKVTLSDYAGWVNHSMTYFDRCLAREHDL